MPITKLKMLTQYRLLFYCLAKESPKLFRASKNRVDGMKKDKEVPAIVPMKLNTLPIEFI